MSPISTMSDAELEELLQPIWTYLSVNEEPRRADLIFVFGGLDLAVPRRAAELFRLHFADRVLVTGALGPLNRDVFEKTEAETFSDEMVRCGVDPSAIFLEKTATNTLENVLRGMKVAAEQGLQAREVILTAKPFLMRRCLATFQRHQPQVKTTCCPPTGSVIQFIDRDRTKFGSRLIAELKRLKDYGEKGDIAVQPVPDSVNEAVRRLESVLGEERV